MEICQGLASYVACNAQLQGATITIKCHLMIDTGSPHPRGGNELKYCGQVNYKLNNRARCAASRHRPQVECEFQTKIERIKGGRADAALET